MLIPRIIHQSAQTDDLPLDVRENIASISDNNPNWQYRFYDDAAVVKYIQNHFDRKILRLFHQINPIYGAARADFFRYLLLFREGGLWLDIKSTTVRSLDEVIGDSDTVIFSQWENRLGELYPGTGFPDPLLRDVPGGEIQQWFVLAAPNNPYIGAVINACIYQIKNYATNTHGVGSLGVFRTTGPTLFTLVVYQKIRHHPCRLVRSFSDLGLKYSFYIENNMATPRERFAHRKLADKQHYSELKEPVVIK